MAFGFNFGFAGRFAHLFTGDGWVENRRLVSQREEENRKLLHQYLQMPDTSGTQLIDQTLFSNPGTAIEASFQTGAMLVNEYRGMALDPDVDIAIDDVVNAMVTTDEDVDPVNVRVVPRNDHKRVISEATENKIKAEFQYILELMDFRQTGYEKSRQWYVDGRQYYQMVVDPEKPSEGIKKLVQLDPRALKKVLHVERRMDPKEKRDVIIDEKRFFLYSPSWAIDATYGGTLTTPAPLNNGARVSAVKEVLRIDPKAIAYCHSGIESPDGGLIFSHLEKARKPLNNLKMMRDAMVIYRMTRAPERRVHYVDVGTLPPKSSKEYVADYARQSRTEFYYDPNTGKVSGATTQESIIQDIYMPRREGGRGSEVTTLQAGQNLGQIEDILYFQKVMFRALNVPVGRLETDGASALFGGNGGEITRDEWKFNKFIMRLRRRYAMLFEQILRVHLVLKNICTEEEFDTVISPNITFEFAGDSYVESQKESHTINERVSAASAAMGLEKLVSRRWIQSNILRMSEDEIVEVDSEIDEDIAKYGEPDTNEFDGNGFENDNPPAIKKPSKPEEKEKSDPTK